MSGSLVVTKTLKSKRQGRRPRTKRISDPEIAEVEIPLVIMSFRNGAVK